MLHPKQPLTAPALPLLHVLFQTQKYHISKSKNKYLNFIMTHDRPESLVTSLV